MKTETDGARPKDPKMQVAVNKEINSSNFKVLLDYSEPYRIGEFRNRVCFCCFNLNILFVYEEPCSFEHSKFKSVSYV